MSSFLINAYSVIPGTYNPGGLGTWTPTDALLSACKTWLDAADTGTLTVVSSKVTVWTDKSGNGVSPTPQTVNGPTTGTVTQNGLNVLVFDGTVDLGKGGVTLPDNSPGVTVLAVAKYTDPAVAGWIAYGTDAGATDFSFSLGRAGNNNMVVTGDGVHAASFNDNTTNYQVLSGIATTTLRQLWQNGTSQGTNSNVDAAKTTGRLYVGSDNNPAVFLTGNIAEILVFEGTDTTNRQKGEGYLAWKWGLQTSLDAGHPYKGGGPNT